MTLLLHVPWEGGGDFFNGMAHPIFDAAHGLSIAGAGLWAGQTSERASRCLLSGVFCGALAGMVSPPMGNVAGWTILASIGISGAAVAARWKPSEKVMIPYGVLLAIAILTQARGEGATVVMAGGTTLGLLVIALLTAAFSRKMDEGKLWQMVSVRVLGSWLMAIALLMLALNV